MSLTDWDIVVLSDDQTMSFFEEIEQMVITHVTIQQLQHERIYNVDYVIYFYKETLDQVNDDLKYPGVWVTDPNPGAIVGATNQNPSFCFGAIMHNHLL